MNETKLGTQSLPILPAALLRLEGVAVFFGAIALYFSQGASGFRSRQ